MHKAHPFYVGAAVRMALAAGGLALCTTIIGVSTVPSIRDTLAARIGPRPLLKLIVVSLLLTALTSLKNFPFMWHARVLGGMFHQLRLQHCPLKPEHLFKPLVISSRNSLFDCDYNLHKSNSTYFADLDVAHMHAVGLIIRTALDRLDRGDETGIPEGELNTPGAYRFHLGGVSCSFHKQIEPLQQFEIHTRVLSWDHKWLYLLSHFVKKNALRPKEYLLQPWKTTSVQTEQTKGEIKDLNKLVFATSIARYVAKKGRLTLNPEVVLERSYLLPARPAGVGYPPRTEESAVLAGPGDQITEHCDWTWEAMEGERLEGLRLAFHFDALSQLRDELKDGDVLGEFGGLW